MWTDTPLPPDEPAGQNPPDGQIIDYYLKENASNVTLDIFNDRNQLVRSYSSSDTLYSIPPLNIPLYWIRPQQILSASAGAHRFVWDMHYSPLNIPPGYPIGAVYQNTAPSSTSPWVMPGNYKIRMKVNGSVYTQSFSIKMDPRVKASLHDLKIQHDQSLICYERRKQISQAVSTLHSLRQQLKNRLADAIGAGVSNLTSCDQQAIELETPFENNKMSFSDRKSVV